MTGEEQLVQELKKYRRLCCYPSSGADVSDLDFFGSGKMPLEERRNGILPGNPSFSEKSDLDNTPDLFLHTDINFYQEFASGRDWAPAECGLHGRCEILEFRELPALNRPNKINPNYEHSGRCFEYKLSVWGSKQPKTLIYCLCENEFVVSQILLAHRIPAAVIWSRNWTGGRTYGTWLANVLDQLHTVKVYTDWLCVPGKRGEPRNRLVEEAYPELMTPSKVKLVRNNDLQWIDEGTHGWVEEFDVVRSGP